MDQRIDIVMIGPNGSVFLSFGDVCVCGGGGGGGQSFIILSSISIISIACLTLYITVQNCYPR